MGIEQGPHKKRTHRERLRRLLLAASVAGAPHVGEAAAESDHCQSVCVSPGFIEWLEEEANRELTPDEKVWEISTALGEESTRRLRDLLYPGEAPIPDRTRSMLELTDEEHEPIQAFVDFWFRALQEDLELQIRGDINHTSVEHMRLLGFDPGTPGFSTHPLRVAREYQFDDPTVVPDDLEYTEFFNGFIGRAGNEGVCMSLAVAHFEPTTDIRNAFDVSHYTLLQPAEFTNRIVPLPETVEASGSGRNTTEALRAAIREIFEDDEYQELVRASVLATESIVPTNAVEFLGTSEVVIGDHTFSIEGINATVCFSELHVSYEGDEVNGFQMHVTGQFGRVEPQ